TMDDSQRHGSFLDMSDGRVSCFIYGMGGMDTGCEWGHCTLYPDKLAEAAGSPALSSVSFKLKAIRRRSILMSI
ncbi:hypothetical protein, partial [Pseudomonas syringae]|uniref:hypothetical protein n=1 Tax=Pseudomonas syringae TaxID=317 RepID=UPI001C7EEE70